MHPGQLYEATFVARNLTGHDTVAQAVPNIAPGEAASWFHKTECFCFTPQSFQARTRSACCRCASSSTGAAVDIDRVTLSYTFYDVTLKSSPPARARTTYR